MLCFCTVHGANMNHRKLPPFKTVTDTELRKLWRKYPDEDVRRLILEVVRYRGVIKEVDGLYQSIHKSWRAETKSNLVALHLLQGVMIDEKGRMG